MLSEYDPFSSDTTFLDQVISDLIDETIEARGIVPVKNGETDDDIIFNLNDYNTIFQGTYSNYSPVQINRDSLLTEMIRNVRNDRHRANKNESRVIRVRL